MLVFETLEFNNVFSYGPTTQHLSLNSSTLTLLNGLNGAGKSSIPTIFEELFYNKNSRGIKKSDVKNRQAKSYYIASSFRLDNNQYKLTKTVTSTAKLVLTKNGQDISGHTATQTYEILEKIIGLDFNTFSKLVYQSMASSLDFLTATDANRKKFLVSLLGLEKYAEIQDTIKEYLSQTKADVKSHSEKESYILTSIGKIDSTKLTEKPLEVEPLPPGQDLYDKVSLLKTQIKSISETNAEIELNIKAKKALDSAKEPTPVETAISVLDFADKLPVVKANIARVLQDKKSFESIKTGCPTCLRPFEEHDAKHKTDAIAKCQEQLEALTHELKLLEHEKSVAQKHEDYKSQLLKYNAIKSAFDSSKPTQLLSLNSLVAELNALSYEINQKNTEVESARARNLLVEKHNAEVSVVAKQLQQLKTDAIQVSKDKSIAQNRLNKLEILQAAFGTKGLISYKIESSIKAFEEMINEYLALLSEGRFALTFEVEETKLALNLLDLGEQISITSLSSGELSRVNTACLLAIRKMMTAICKVDINLLFLDEVVSVLDKEGKDTLVDVLLSEKLNSFAVSHGYSHPLASTLHVVKREGFSYVE